MRESQTRKKGGFGDNQIISPRQTSREWNLGGECINFKPFRLKIDE